LYEEDVIARFAVRVVGPKTANSTYYIYICVLTSMCSRL